MVAGRNITVFGVIEKGSAFVAGKGASIVKIKSIHLYGCLRFEDSI